MSEIVFGVPDKILPLKGFPDGKIRLKLRNTAFAVAYVKTKHQIASFAIEEKDGFFIPSFRLGANFRI